ncbi:MAG: ABC transporter ATP-binding protein [Rhodobiaceae bacterium]|nr:ABC transporter ATP-binding protein [Rhodobiaceae bacterium]|tara:strand:- start:5275 stop:6360 length:1086 start_codon:yes stop_codon:yes gene_type:complete
MSAFLKVQNLSKKFDNHQAVDNISFEIEEKKLFVLLGPSGCGKTTTLRCIGGLEKPDSGIISINNEIISNNDEQIYIPAEKRGMGMVAQSYAIWPHMTVFENIAFPLRMANFDKNNLSARVEDALNMVQLKGLGSRNATDLSGGQQQRVALARAIVGRPKLLLFDEPLSNLDAKLREQMRYLLKEIQTEIGITAVYVTHDQSEAMGLGDELIVMNEGRIEQSNQARTLYNNPKTKFVGEFIGTANLIEGKAVVTSNNSGQINLSSGQNELLIRARISNSSITESATLLFRPEWISIDKETKDNKDNSMLGIVKNYQYLGDRSELIIETDFADIKAIVIDEDEYKVGDEVRIIINPKKAIIF